MEYFAERIEQWYAQHKRDLPWRGTKDPYRIWVSEIILQQTRVAQGWDYYLRFTARFPTVEALAAADEDEVMRMWQGLGYYSRARNLHHAAGQVVEMGGFPTTYAEIRSLRGVGEYTASAIASMAFSLPHPVLDGNVFRVLSRYFALDTPIDTARGKRAFQALAESLLDSENPGLYNQAIMDFGALQCVPSSPDCRSCPLNDSCMALQKGSPADYPVKSHKTKVRPRFFTYIYIVCNGHIAIRKRAGRDIWSGLYEPFLKESERPLTADEIVAVLDAVFPPEMRKSVNIKCLSTMNKHVLSHQILWADFYEVRVGACNVLPSIDGYGWVAESERDAYAYPRLVLKLFEDLARGES